MISARLTYRLRFAVALSMGVCAAVGAGVLAFVMSDPTSDFAARFSLTAVSEARAEAAAQPETPDLRRVEAETRRTLESRPGDAAAWSRLAWVAAQHGRRADMLDALDRSYTVSPYGPEVTAWRLRFAYGRWGALTPDLRRLAAAELTVAARHRPRLVGEVWADIPDPAGRLAFAMTRSSAGLASTRTTNPR